MKKNSAYILMGMLLLFLFSSCIKQIDKTFQGDTVVEVDATVLNSATTPYTYHVATRTPPYGIPTTTANSTAITRTSGVVKLRVNLVGPIRSQDEVINYHIMTGVTPAAPNLIAVAGTHYTTGSSFTIPTGSTFGEITINIINPGVSSTSPREVHLELDGGPNVKASQNYKQIGIRIAQN